MRQFKRWLSTVFNSRRGVKRMETLTKIFRYSRSEDIAKVFELGRIEALSRLRKEVYSVISLVSFILAVLGFYLVNDYFILKVNSVVDSKVEKELEKRIDGFKNFFSESREIIPFSVLVIQASNDDRVAFDKLIAVSKDSSHTYHKLAEALVINITANINPSVVIHPIDPQNPEEAISRRVHIDLQLKFCKVSHSGI